MTNDHDCWPTPEEAALAGWAGIPSARARVREVTVHGDKAEVVIVTDPPYEDWVYCQRTHEGWREAISGSGPNVGWREMRWAEG